jgi:hypothetical protein
VTTFKENLSEAIRYWEPRRILYNAVLTLIVLAHFALLFPVSKAALKLDLLLLLFLLAVLANVAYCAAYLVDLFAQSSELRSIWLQYRWVLLLIGITFASVLTHFFALSLFQPDI